MKYLIDSIFIYLLLFQKWQTSYEIFECILIHLLRMQFLIFVCIQSKMANFVWINYMIECILIHLLLDDWCLKNGHSTLLQHLMFHLLRMTGIYVWWILPSFNECWSSSFWSSFFGFCWLNWFIFFHLHWSRCTVLKYLSDYSCKSISSSSSRC